MTIPSIILFFKYKNLPTSRTAVRMIPLQYDYCCTAVFTTPYCCDSEFPIAEVAHRSNPLVAHDNIPEKHTVTTVSLGVKARGDRRPEYIPRNTLHRHCPVNLSMIPATTTVTRRRLQYGIAPPTAPPTAKAAAAATPTVVVVAAVTATALPPPGDRAIHPRAPGQRQHDHAEQRNARGPLGPPPTVGLLPKQTLRRMQQT